MGVRRWTQATAEAALRAWIAEHGRQPTYNEWRPRPPGCPSRDTLRVLFGSWSEAMGAAGGARFARGEYDREPQRAPRAPCPVCGRTYRPKARRKYCSAQCAGIAKAKGTRSRAPRGYRQHLGHGMHREIAERWLGRRLQRCEVVHHVDGDTLNNRLSNLAVLGNAEHVRLHWHGGEVTALDGTVYQCRAVRDGTRGRGWPRLMVFAAERSYAFARV